jgi:glyoxylase-like metal-dependent hydrolase (beta-lactamase superfamily II)
MLLGPKVNTAKRGLLMERREAPMTPLPSVDAWYRSRVVAAGVTRIDEPAVHDFLQSNIWHIAGRDRDLVVDSGLGVAPLRTQLPNLFQNDPILVISHAHLDHVGAAHEFEDRRMHAVESDKGPVHATLYSAALSTLLGWDGSALPELLIDAVPFDGYDPRDYRIDPIEVTTELHGGDVIDLGDRQFTVLHLPGHTPGSICLFDEKNGDLFSGDVIYDDLLLDELHESNIYDYVRSMRSLQALSPSRIYPGHGASFNGERARDIVEAYLALRVGY